MAEHVDADFLDPRHLKCREPDPRRKFEYLSGRTFSPQRLPIRSTLLGERRYG
jgi:hypothetical protein